MAQRFWKFHPEVKTGICFAGRNVYELAGKAMKLDLPGIGARLEAIRTALDLNKNEFAASFGLDPSSYSKVIQGDKPLKAEHAFALAERWGLTMDYVYRGRFNDLPASLASKLRAT